MSLSKLCLFTTLVVIIALAAVRRLDVTNEFRVLTSNSRPSHPAVVHDESPAAAYELSDRTGHPTR